MVAMLVNGSGQNEQSLQRIFHKWFLPSFSSFGQAVLEEKIFQKLINQKQEFPVAAMFVNGSGQNVQSLKRTLPQMFPTEFPFIWGSSFRGEDFQKSANQKRELPVAAMFVNGLGQNEQSLQRTFHRRFLPSFSSFGQAVSEIKRFLEIGQSETRIACGGQFCKRIRTKCAIFIADLTQMLPTKFQFI